MSKESRELKTLLLQKTLQRLKKQPPKTPTAIKKDPTGFVATCQCKRTVGALDWQRTDRKEAGKILGKWLADGCTVTPRFESSWTVSLANCTCRYPSQLNANQLEKGHAGNE